MSILQQNKLFQLFFLATFDDLASALKRLNTLKYLANQYHLFFTSNLNILVAVRIVSCSMFFSYLIYLESSPSAFKYQYKYRR
jgi:hypothetical protein